MLGCFFQGCGKSMMVKQFADLLGYHIEPVMLYQVCIVDFIQSSKKGRNVNIFKQKVLNVAQDLY